MLKIIIVELLTKYFVFVDKDNIINGVGDDINKVNKTKSKNKVMPDFLAKSKLLVEISFGLHFLTFRARLVFAKLKQTFIETSIFYHFDLKYHICIRSNVFDYIINNVFIS